MQKKSLDVNIGIDDYNKKVFAKSMELFFNCKKIPIDQVSAMHKNQSIKKKYNAIDQKLQNILKILRNFTQTQKPTFNNPIDLASQILEQTKLQVQIQFRRAQEEKNTLKRIKAEQANKQQRPQDRYPDIKVYQSYDEHSHQTYLEDGLIPELKICQKVQQPSNINDQFIYVDTPEKLDAAIRQMKQFTQLAVDVEHSPKSYHGFTCLIQISTRARDYLIDVFPIWSSVPALQEVIGNPNILKVMHGAEMDTKWLQRDFNIHIINLFDTHKASRVLGMPKFSYAHLLHHYCGVTANKAFQRADWRERPLSAEMLKYGRADTHYLLTIYDHVRMDLQKQAKSMNLSVTDIFRDIQKSSHQVTLANAELFSHKTMPLYSLLQYQLQDKKQQFKGVESILSEISLAAMKTDENFEDLISKKDLLQAISFIKDLAFNKKSKVSKQTRIQKIMSILQRGNAIALTNALENIKADLNLIFCNKPIQTYTQNNQKEDVKKNQKENIKQQSKINEIQTFQTFTRQKNNSVKFSQLYSQSFKIQEPKNKIKIKFIPITGFLSQKYGIQQIKQQQAEDKNNESGQMQEQQQMQQERQKNEQQDEEQGVIQFKRMNNNVKYVVQKADPEVENALKTQHPRKMKKQTQYENRLRNKTGNIYDMLEND